MGKPRIDENAFPYSTLIPVRWADQDALGHVNHAHYLTYFEQARCACIAERGLFVEGGCEGPVVAWAELRYRTPVKYPAALRFYLRVASLRESAFRMDFAARNETTGQWAAEGAALVVWTNLIEGRRAPLPADWMRALRGLGGQEKTSNGPEDGKLSQSR
ncbi:MAG: Thioesterase superfamily protein [candidate division BRC1 bacterium ADurb.BinA364]|nr:MAG: Thioesterase superfamily protein [candidate division BRC1 bacterium ADurb.BinA364]